MMHAVVVSLIAVGYVALLATPCIVASRIDLDGEDSQ